MVAAGLAAGAAAWIVTARARARVRDLRAWLARVRRGEASTPPLRVGRPDPLDGFASEVGEVLREREAQLGALADERDRLGAVLAAMVEGVLVIDARGTVLRANAAVTEIFGLASAEEIVGRRLWSVSRDAAWTEAVRDALAGAGPTVREVRVRGTEERFLGMTASPTADGSAWVLVLHDVTERRHLERVRTDFVANVSHELRTPLTAIRGFAERLASGEVRGPEDTRRAAAIIERQATRLTRLIDDLLALSDLELGSRPVRIGRADLSRAAREGAALLEEEARRAGLRLSLSAPEETPVRGDTDRLVQVVSNLLENAIKHTPRGGEVALSVGRSGSWAELRVRDSGIGIPADDLPRVTERFYRVDRARSAELGGTGLGLSIVKHIVQAHGGALEIESRVGVGTQVCVRLRPC